MIFTYLFPIEVTLKGKSAQMTATDYFSLLECCFLVFDLLEWIFCHLTCLNTSLSVVHLNTVFVDCSIPLSSS